MSFVLRLARRASCVEVESPLPLLEGQRHGDHVAAGHPDRRLGARVLGIEEQHLVPGADQDPERAVDDLLGADRDQHLVVGVGVHAVLALELPRDGLAEVLVPLDAGIVGVLVDGGTGRVPDEVRRQAVADRPARQAHDVAELLREVAQVARGRHGAGQRSVRVVQHQGRLHAAGQPSGRGGLGQTGLARLSLALLHGHSPRCGSVSFTPGSPPGPAGRPPPAARRPARHGTGRRRSGSGRAAARGAAARTAPRASPRAARAGSG